jgi:hypothetical protein
VARNRVDAFGRQLTLPVIAGTLSGGPVIVGMLPGVALTDRDSSGNATVQVGQGVFNVSVTGALASVGLPVYIVSATYALVCSVGQTCRLGDLLESRARESAARWAGFV